MISEIRIVTLSVANLERAVAFYRDGLGYRELGRGAVPAGLAGPWRIPDGLAGEQVVLASDDRGLGMLRIVSFGDGGEPIYERLQDAGHYAANYRVDKLHATLARLVEYGAQSPPWSTAPIEPHHWVLAGIEVWDSMFRDPDGAMVDVYEIVKTQPPFGELEGTVAPLETMAIHVVDAERSRAFYEALGYRVLFDKFVDAQPFLGMPPGAQIRDVNLMMRGDVIVGRIELAQRIGHGDVASLEERAVPPNLGYLSISFESDDLAADTATALSNGARLVAGPVEVTLPALGAVRLSVVLGPDGEALELYQRA